MNGQQLSTEGDQTVEVTLPSGVRDRDLALCEVAVSVSLGIEAVSGVVGVDADIDTVTPGSDTVVFDVTTYEGEELDRDVIKMQPEWLASHPDDGTNN